MIDALAPHGHKLMPQEELTLEAAADLDNAASAWSALLTARELFAVQPENGPVELARFERLSAWLADDFDRAVRAFRRHDDALRSKGGLAAAEAKPAEPIQLEAALVTIEAAGLSSDETMHLVRLIAGTSDLADIDRRGVDWLGQFLDLAGREPPQRAPDRSRRASRQQIALVRAMFLKVERQEDPDDRRLTAWVESRYGYKQIEALDAVSGWRAILYLRENLVACHWVEQ